MKYIIKRKDLMIALGGYVDFATKSEEDGDVVWEDWDEIIITTAKAIPPTAPFQELFELVDEDDKPTKS